MPRPAHNNNPDRRAFLKQASTAALAGAFAAAATPRPLSAAQASARTNPRAKNLIFMVADGMSTGSLVLTDLFLRERHARRLHWLDLMRRPEAHRALVDTASADGHVTDSAASATAWSIGQRVKNGAVCFTPDGRAPIPLFLRAKQRGKSVGVVSTTRVTDASPACFIANAPSRTLEDDIAQQLLHRATDVILGGGAKHFPPDLLLSRPDLRIVRDRASLLALAHNNSAPPSALLGLFAPSHMAYTLDRPGAEPTLAEMTAAALRTLRASSPDGFVLCVEGARIDHAAHANDAASIVNDLVAFDEALAIAIEHCDADPETLLIVTTDHANANPGLATYGAPGVRQFSTIQRVTQSFEWILGRLASLPAAERTGESLAALVQQASGVTLEDSEIAILSAWRRGERVDPYLSANNQSSPLGSVLANHHGVAFTGPTHTSDYVECTALGPGADQLPPLIGIEELHYLATTALALPNP